MEDKSSITSLISAFARAVHAEYEENPVFCDNLARKLLSNDEYKMIENYVLGGIDFFEPDKKGTFSSDTDALRYLVNTHLAPTPLCRSAYCENALKTAVKTGTEQYVILGAGLDTFAFREKEFAEKYKIFELDHPKTQADKLMRIKRANWEIPENLTFVDIDFTTGNIAAKLVKNGFNPQKKTFFSWLGVSYYLYRDEIENTLKSLRQIMADGSTIVFDYADAGLFTSKVRRVQNMVAMAKAGGEEMKSSFDFMSAELMMSDLGFLVYEHLTPKDIQAQVIKNGSIKAFEHINYIQAVYKRK